MLVYCSMCSSVPSSICLCSSSDQSADLYTSTISCQISLFHPNHHLTVWNYSKIIVLYTNNIIITTTLRCKTSFVNVTNPCRATDSSLFLGQLLSAWGSQFEQNQYFSCKTYCNFSNLEVKALWPKLSIKLA